MEKLHCLCLKYGTLYGPEYVNRLAAALARNSEGRAMLWCLTDNPRGIDPRVKLLPLSVEPFADRMEAALITAPKRGRLKKISLFRKGLIPNHVGPILVLDLDIAITGDIAPLFTFAPGKVCMRRVWGGGGPSPSIGHGSVERFDPQLHPYLYDFMAENPEKAVAFGGGSEQTYTSKSAHRAGDFAAFPDEWIASFKYDCRPIRPLNLLFTPRLPAQAKVVCFHGRPKMDEAVAGYHAGPLHSTRPAPWLRDAWIGDEQ
jgi:hypothetical protein